MFQCQCTRNLFFLPKCSVPVLLLFYTIYFFSVLYILFCANICQGNFHRRNYMKPILNSNTNDIFSRCGFRILVRLHIIATVEIPNLCQTRTESNRLEWIYPNRTRTRNRTEFDSHSSFTFCSDSVRIRFGMSSADYSIRFDSVRIPPKFGISTYNSRLKNIVGLDDRFEKKIESVFVFI